MTLIHTLVLALALLASAGRAGAQDKSPRTFTIPVGHVVTIVWTASTTSDVTAYKIYVSGTHGGPYSPIGTTAGLKFSDLKASAGNTYFYVVTAVDVNGESGFSAEAAVTVPIP